MSDAKSVRIPKYRLRKPTGLGLVRIRGRDFQLGRHGTQESLLACERAISEWLADKYHCDSAYDQNQLGVGRDPERYFKAVRLLLVRARAENKPFFIMAHSHEAPPPHGPAHRPVAHKRRLPPNRGCTPASPFCRRAGFTEMTVGGARGQRRGLLPCQGHARGRPPAVRASDLRRPRGRVVGEDNLIGLGLSGLAPPQRQGKPAP